MKKPATKVDTIGSRAIIAHLTTVQVLWMKKQKSTSGGAFYYTHLVDSGVLGLMSQVKQ